MTVLVFVFWIWPLAEQPEQRVFRSDPMPIQECLEIKDALQRQTKGGSPDVPPPKIWCQPVGKPT